MEITFHRDTNCETADPTLVQIGLILGGICASDMTQAELQVAQILVERNVLVETPVKHEGYVVDYAYEVANVK